MIKFESNNYCSELEGKSLWKAETRALASVSMLQKLNLTTLTNVRVSALYPNVQVSA